MNEHLLKMALAFAMGTGATIGVLRLLRFLPVPRYIKQVLSIVVPLPAILIALVMLHYGPEEISNQASAIPSSAGDLWKMFSYGIVTVLGYLLVAKVMRMVMRKTFDDE